MYPRRRKSNGLLPEESTCILVEQERMDSCVTGMLYLYATRAPAVYLNFVSSQSKSRTEMAASKTHQMSVPVLNKDNCKLPELRVFTELVQNRDGGLKNTPLNSTKHIMQFSRAVKIIDKYLTCVMVNKC